MANSSVESQMADFTDSILDQFGENITYTPAGGAARTIKAIIFEETRTEHAEASATEEFESIEIQISDQDDTNGVISPTVYGFLGQEGDSLVMDVGQGNETWYVKRGLENNVAGMHTLGLTSKRIAFADPWGV